MLSRLSQCLYVPPVSRDVRRLTQSYGSEALFVARRAVFAAREVGRHCHWRRVLQRIEHQSAYRPW